MITIDDIDADPDEPPWSDTEPAWDEALLADLGDKFDVTKERMVDSSKKEAWLDDQELPTTLLVGSENVQAVDPDTRFDHNYHVYTTFTTAPSMIGMADGLDEIINYHTTRKVIDQHTDYRITNTRLVEYDSDTVLVLTLAPDRDE